MSGDGDGELTCSVCLEIFTDPVRINCAGQHFVCKSHVEELARQGRGNKCPLGCTTPVDLRNCPVERFMKNMCDQRRQRGPTSVSVAPPQSSQSNRLETIFVMSMAGKKSLHKVDGATRLGELKQMIQDKDGLDMSKYWLIWSGRKLEDDSKTLADYKLQNLQTVHVVLRHIGGMFPWSTGTASQSAASRKQGGGNARARSSRVMLRPSSP